MYRYQGTPVSRLMPLHITKETARVAPHPPCTCLFFCLVVWGRNAQHLSARSWWIFTKKIGMKHYCFLRSCLSTEVASLVAGFHFSSSCRVRRYCARTGSFPRILDVVDVPGFLKSVVQNADELPARYRYNFCIYIFFSYGVSPDS